MSEYSHILIPESADFVPEPTHVESFLSSLISIGAAPLNHAIRVSKLRGESRILWRPSTGHARTLLMRTPEKLQELNAIPGALSAMEDYDLALDGKGPPQLPAMTLDFNGAYPFSVCCHLRAEAISLSNPRNPLRNTKATRHVGQMCAVLESPSAGCARFWIEFKFGKLLFPRDQNSADAIEPRIIEIAEKEFGVEFLQGCNWCE
jgi:hypothetical protein